MNERILQMIWDGGWFLFFIAGCLAVWVATS